MCDEHILYLERNVEGVVENKLGGGLGVVEASFGNLRYSLFETGGYGPILANNRNGARIDIATITVSDQ